MEEIIIIDKQGRLVLPSKIREALGIKNGGEVLIRFSGEKVTIEPSHIDIEEKATEWGKLARKHRSEAFSSREEESCKWVSDEYARKKLGLS